VPNVPITLTARVGGPWFSFITVRTSYPVVLAFLHHIFEPTITLFMSPFSRPRNPYRKTIEAKRTQRDEAIKFAPSFEPKKHQKYLDSTGNTITVHLVFILHLFLYLA
jgi:hypothetical protein